MLIGVLVINLTASSYAVLLPVFAKDVFAGQASLLGWLWGAAGCGALLAAVFLSVYRGREELNRVIVCAALISAAALLTFALSTSLPLSLLAMLVLGFGISTSNIGTNILLQGPPPKACADAWSRSIPPPASASMRSAACSPGYWPRRWAARQPWLAGG